MIRTQLMPGRERFSADLRAKVIAALNYGVLSFLSPAKQGRRKGGLEGDSWKWCQTIPFALAKKLESLGVSSKDLKNLKRW